MHSKGYKRSLVAFLSCSMIICAIDN